MNTPLDRIKIKGFKSIKECDIKLNNINVFIGANGSGKSNLITAFSLLTYLLREELSLYVAKKGADSLLFNGPKITDNISMEFHFGNNSYSFVLELTENKELVFRYEKYGFKGNYDSNTNISSGHKESLWRKGTGQHRDLYIIPVLESLQWRIYHFHDTGVDSKIKQEHNVAHNNFLMQNAHNIAAFLLRLKIAHNSHYQNIIETIRLVAPFFKDFELEPNPLNKELIVLKWRQKGCEDIFNASQFSDGTLRFICLATLLLQPKEIQPSTIIIDEPELGLHPFAIALLAEMIKSASIQRQIIVTTQSVELLNHFEPEDVIVVERKNDCSEFKRLDTEKLKIWLEDDYSLGELWNKNILGGRP